MQDKKVKAPILITSHMNADFDALAAMIAASKLYEGAVLIFPGSQEKNLRNFFIQSTTYLFNFKSFKDIDPDSVELLVVVDTRQRSRLSHVAQILDDKLMKIHVYDHHPDSDEDVRSDYAEVKPWGSTTAIMVEKMQRAKVSVSEEEATMLGLGIYEDTGGFSFNSTTEHDFMAAAWLKARGMDLNVIADLLSRDLSAEQVSILNDLLDSAETHDINGVEVVVCQVSTEYFVADFAFLVHKVIDMENVRVLFALGRMSDRIHLVARSKTPDVDVGHICSFFGGGGHAYAASATIKDRTMAEVRDDLFTLLYSHINPNLHVENLMSKRPMTIRMDQPMSQAVDLMTRFGLKGVPVVDEKGSCVGLLDHHLADKALAHGLGDLAVEVYMLRDVTTLPPEADLFKVMEAILGQKQRLVPVVKGHKVVGVITRTDLINLLIKEPARIPESLLPERKRERNIKSLMRNRLPDEMFRLLVMAGTLAQDLGFEAFAVGGFVRDILLGRNNLDLDLVVEGDGIDFARELAERLDGRVKPHPKFKTAVVVLGNGQRVDVATARLEYYEYPAALPTVELSSIKMDLYRRDFTINALALHLNPGDFGKLVDFFGAQRDIKDKVIRVLHSLSFVEDPTRILRAVRFEQRFGFRIGGQTLRLVKNALSLQLISKLSGSRVFHELKLILEEEDPLPCLERLDKLGLLEAVHPIFTLDQAKIRVLEEGQKILTWHRLLYKDFQAETWKIYLLGLCMGVEEKQVLGVYERLNFSKRDARQFTELRRHIYHASGEIMQWQSRKGALSELYFILEPVPLEGLLFLMARSKKESTRKHISMYLTSLKDLRLEITGNDLKEMGVRPGPVYTVILRGVRAAIIDGQVRDRTEQLAEAERLARAESKAV